MGSVGAGGRGHRSLLPNPQHPDLHRPVPTHKPVGKQAHQLLPLGKVGPPRDHHGAGERDVEGALHPPGLQDHVPMAERRRCRPSGSGGTFWVQARSGCLAARVTWSRGGLVWAWPKSSGDGMGTTTSRATCPAGGAGLAAGACRTSIPPRALTAHTAGLARGPSTPGASRPVATGTCGPVAVLLGQSGPGLVPAPGVAPNVRRPRGEQHLQMRGCVQGTN